MTQARPPPAQLSLDFAAPAIQTPQPSQDRGLWTIYAVPDRFDLTTELQPVTDVYRTEDGLRVELFESRHAALTWPIVLAMAEDLKAGIWLEDASGCLTRIDGTAVAIERAAIDAELDRRSNARLVCEPFRGPQPAVTPCGRNLRYGVT